MPKLKKRLKSAAESLYFRVVPGRMRGALRLWAYLDWPDRTPVALDSFGPEPVLVLAPHMDDEVIGPGGTLRRHVEAGAAVTVVFLTDGRLGGYDDGTLAQRRKDESRRAAELLGFGDLVFLDGPDGKLRDEPRLVEAVANLIAEKKPAVVYAPAVTDGHADHWGSNRVLYAALKSSPAPPSGLLVRGYEVWSPLPANRLCDITAQAELKRKAIELFPSQTRIDDYARTALGLNQYRSAPLLHGHGYAEAFLEANVAEYRRLFETVQLRHRDVERLEQARVAGEWPGREMTR